MLSDRIYLRFIRIHTFLFAGILNATTYDINATNNSMHKLTIQSIALTRIQYSHKCKPNNSFDRVAEVIATLDRFSDTVVTLVQSTWTHKSFPWEFIASLFLPLHSTEYWEHWIQILLNWLEITVLWLLKITRSPLQ